MSVDVILREREKRLQDKLIWTQGAVFLYFADLFSVMFLQAPLRY